MGANLHRSWLLGEQPAVAVGLTVATASLFALAGIGLIVGAGWWGPVTVAAAGD